MIKYFIISLLCLTKLFSSTPEWYLNIKQKPDIIYGYGKDIKQKTAKELATKMIQKRINHKIIPKYLTFVRKAEKDGITYVAYSYNTTSIFDKIYLKRDVLTANSIPLHPLLKVSPLYREIAYKIKFKPNFKLIKEKKSWYIAIDKYKFYLDILHFPNLFSNITHQKFQFKTNRRVFKYPDNIKFTINALDKGYVSILYSSPYGEVKSIVSNEEITTKEFKYPYNDNNKLIIYNDDDIAIKELYIAIVSKKPLDLSPFEFLDDRLLLDGSNYNFDKLLPILKDNDFSTIKVLIKPGNERKTK